MSGRKNPRGSNRVAWESGQNSYSASVAGLQAASVPLIDLTVSNPTRCGIGNWNRSLAEAFASIDDFSYVPAPDGVPAAREAVALHYRQQGIDASPERIVLSASSSESYAFLFQALCDPNDEVLAPLPSYPLFEFLAGFSAVKLVHYRLRYESEWLLDFASLENAVTPRTRAIVVVNPNNPTGSFLREFERARLLSICARYGLVLIADEVFADYPLLAPADRATFAGAQDVALAVSLGGLSKSAGLPQWKVGWMLVNGPKMDAAWLLERLRLAGDTFLSVSTPAQLTLPHALKVGTQIRAALRERLSRNLGSLRKAVAAASTVSLPRVEGGWTAAIRLPATRSDVEWCTEILMHRGVIAQPGYFYDFENDAWLVLSLLTPEGEFDEGIGRVLEWVDRAVSG